MATHSSVLAWRIPGMGEPGGLPSMGHTESDTTEVTQQQQTMAMAPVICQLIGTLSLVQSRETGHRNIGEMGTTFCLVCPHDFHCDPIFFTLPSLLCHCSISPSSLPYVAQQKTLTCFPLSREDGQGEEKKPTANPSVLKFALGVERVMAGFFSSSKLGNKKSSFNTKY